MIINYDKNEIKQALTSDQIFNLLIEFQGNPTYSGENIISDTIDHNLPNEGSHKLYYYPNKDESGLFVSYTEGQSFDIFELVQKVASIQWHKNLDLNDAVRWIAARFGFSGNIELEDDKEKLKDWDYLANYNKLQELLESNKGNNQSFLLKEYDKSILNKFNYSLKIEPWLKENISQEVLSKAQIGYYLGGDQITIPHFDLNNRLIGVRGRTLCKEDAELYGKYRPLKIGKETYSHPLGLSIYGLNWAKDNIKQMGKAFIFESEKAILQYMSYFGVDNNLAVACCGSNISDYQMNLLLKSGAKEIIIGMDRQFQEIGDDEYKKLTKKLEKINSKYNKMVNLSFIFDKNMITKYKDSPTDINRETFLKLYNERIIL